MRATWHNWSHSVQCTPAEIVYPSSEAEIVDLVRRCAAAGRKLRVVGAGHSFTPLVQTDAVLMSLDRYQGLEHVDRERGVATIRAGTRLKALGALLFAHGLAQENLGDIDVQSIAGAISTGTHGSGLGFGSLSTQVIGLTLVTASGAVMECSEQHNRAVFKAAQVSLGALGIISRVTLRLVPAYRLVYTWDKQPLATTLAHFDHAIRAHRNFEFYWFPYTTTTQIKMLDVTSAPAQPKHLLRQLNETVLENGAFGVLSAIARRWPAQSRRISRIAAAGLSSGRQIDWSQRVFATPRLVKFQEMEYSLPLEHAAPVLREIDACIRRRGFQVHFPLEVRCVRGDDIPLSPAYGRDSVYIAAHMYQGMPYRDYFAAIETIFRRYNGRPHWGKLHTLAAAELAPLYPQWDAFQAVRTQLDPAGRLLNPYLTRLLEPQPAPVPGVRT